ncbi:MAG: tetratricopeptide repeat protein [Methylobacter sp.]|nr:tetratricopeptide repeat protein [Methylobacter sp.]
MRNIFLIIALCFPVTLLYGQFYWNPAVFDDAVFFNGLAHDQYKDKVFSFALRWLPYASLEWTHTLFGSGVIWFRIGNLVLHLATEITLFFFLYRLFEQVISSANEGNEILSPRWLAFFSALIFALHPASVYAAAYLIQRTTLMATLFVLLTWLLFLEGLIRQSRCWLLVSCITYFLAVLSKEHAIMAPAVTMILLLLVNKQSTHHRLMLIWPTFVLYGLIGGFVIFQVKARHILGQAYEPIAVNYLSLLGPDFDERWAYPLSILTQCFLFFKYLWVWLVPSPVWMSVDMPQTFALKLWSWPEIAGLAGFIIYPIISFRLLLKKGVNGLLGFALLCPWLLFATELSTIRIQESFVLYRSYLWMVCAFAALPFLCQKLNPKQAVITLTCVAVFMVPLSWLRLKTFSHPVLLWDDAARLVDNIEERRYGIDRIYFNRGTELMKIKQYVEAIDDFSKVIALKGYFDGDAYYNRSVIFMELKQYNLSLKDINKTIEMAPTKANLYLRKAIALEALNDKTGAMQAYKQACALGSFIACQKMESPESPTKSLNNFFLHP